MKNKNSRLQNRLQKSILSGCPAAKALEVYINSLVEEPSRRLLLELKFLVLDFSFEEGARRSYRWVAGGPPTRLEIEEALKASPRYKAVGQWAHSLELLHRIEVEASIYERKEGGYWDSDDNYIII